MRSFKDINGKDYPLALTVGAFKRVKDQTGVSLDDLVSGDPPLLLRLDGDLTLFGQVLAALTGVDPENMNGASLGQARVAFWAELSDFFRDAGRTEMVKVIQIRERLAEKLNAKLGSLSTSTASPA